MGKNRYVGHRYIPIFENGWDKTRTYEPLTFVYYEGKTYVSRQLVPTNIEITDNDFWAFFMDNAPQIFTPTFMGEWVDKPYEPLSIVVNNGNTYVSKQDVPTGTVLTDETYWLDLSTYYNQLFTGYEAAEQERQQAEAIRQDWFNNSTFKFSNLNTFGQQIAVTQYTGTYTINPSSVNIGDTLYVNREFVSVNGSGHGVEGRVVYGNNTIISNQSLNSSTYKIDKELSSRMFLYGNANADENGLNLTYFNDLMILNLTKIFGAGNEPTVKEMDELLKITGYFDGEIVLSPKNIFTWLLNINRNNTSAIISLGGTI